VIVMHRVVAISYRCFRTIYPFHVIWSRVSGNFCRLYRDNLTVSF